VNTKAELDSESSIVFYNALWLSEGRGGIYIRTLSECVGARKPENNIAHEVLSCRLDERADAAMQLLCCGMFFPSCLWILLPSFYAQSKRSTVSARAKIVCTLAPCQHHVHLILRLALPDLFETKVMIIKPGTTVEAAKFQNSISFSLTALLERLNQARRTRR
jgi:hypothetical protein